MCVEASVIGVPDPRWDERPLACVVRKAGLRRSTPPTLAAFLGEHVAKWQIPERWSFIDEVPKTSVGKFDKKVLRARHEKGDLVEPGSSEPWSDRRRSAPRDRRPAARRRARPRSAARRVGRRSSRSTAARGCSPAAASIPTTTRTRPTTSRPRRAGPRHGKRRRKPASTSTPTRWCTSRTGRHPRSRPSASRRGSSSDRSPAAARSPTGSRPTAVQWFRPDEALAARRGRRDRARAAAVRHAARRYASSTTVADAMAAIDMRREAIDYTPRFHFVEATARCCVYIEDVAYDDLALLGRGRPPPPPLPARRRLGVRPRCDPGLPRPLLVGLGRQPQVRLQRLPALRELLLGVLVGDRRRR